MPQFLVKFTTPVKYLMDHPKAARDVLELPVHAPDSNTALMHAIRVTNGNPGEMQVELYEPEAVPPPVEVENA